MVAAQEKGHLGVYYLLAVLEVERRPFVQSWCGQVHLLACREDYTTKSWLFTSAGPKILTHYVWETLSGPSLTRLAKED